MANQGKAKRRILSAPAIGLFAMIVCVSAPALAQPSQPNNAAPSAEPTPQPTTNQRPDDIFNKVQIGARVGVNFATAMTDPEDSRLVSRTGMTVGGFVTLALDSRFSVEVGVGYTQRGFKVEPQFFEEIETEVEYDYFEAPALLRGRFKLGSSSTHLRVAGGLNILSLDAARATSFGEPMSIESQTTGYDVAILFGFGIDFALGELTGIADFRYDIGLVNTVDDEDSFETVETFNRVSALMVGLAF